LQEAHQHEKPLPVAPNEVFDPDVTVSEEFVQSHEEFLLFCIYALVQASMRTVGATDADLMSALEALIQTRRTLQSGLVYESRAENMLAVAIQRSFTASLTDYEKLRQERESLSPVRNSEVLAMLVFLRRIGQVNQNGRPRGRMFLGLLRQMTPETGVEERAPSIII
jgi:hypothetical protein